MKVYRAVAGKIIYTGGFFQCIYWARSQLSQYEVISIEKQNAGEDSAIKVAEVCRDGLRVIREGSIWGVNRV